MSASDQKLLPGKKHAPESLGRVLVIGLGKSGMSAVRYLSALVGTRVESVFVAAGAENEKAQAFADQYRGEGVTFAFGCESFTERYDLCIASPGISQFSDFYQNAAAASTEVISEAEFAWRESAEDSRWIAITGTNGKTTTTSLTAFILKRAGFKANAVGNIGDVCLDAVAAGETEIYVAELSSFQLASTSLFTSIASVILNVTPDHLYWHLSFDAYRDAKYKCLDHLNQVSGSLAILDATDEVVRQKVKELKALTPEERGFAYLPLGTMAGIRESMIDRCGASAAAYVDGAETLVIELNGVRHTLCAVDDLQIKGDHNLSNSLAAAACALTVGATDEQIIDGLKAFAPLEHRNEPCGSIAGVRCFNDSKATNVDSTLKALASFAPGTVIALYGGRDKGTDLTPLVEMTHQYGHAVVCFGECQDRFYDAFAANPGNLTLLRAPWLEDALDAALSVARPGDNVVLSPACASFDEFSCFEERGDVFKKLVADRAARLGA
ncbi:MAG: UDP-N-acetylmuramoyl-L-alanine--D-glutamate ligase [Eggerthellales bacterium]|nr:UDP-N-acetylmuramoyl-L-alanine--D-glutamate ligase [Eggerthellales bacterium]